MHNQNPVIEDAIQRTLRANRALSEAEEKLAAKVAALGTLHEIGSMLTSAQLPDDLYQKVADILVDRMGYEMGLVVGPDPSGRLVVRASCACTRSHLADLRALLAGLGMADLQEAATRARLAEVFALPVLFAVPITPKGYPGRSELPEATILVGRGLDGRAQRDDLELLRTLASQVSVGLENNALYARLGQEKDRLEAAKAELVQWAETLEERVSTRTAQIARRNRQLATLNALSKAINQSLDVAEVSASVLRLTGEMLGAKVGAVWLCPPGQPAVLQAQQGLPRHWIRRLRRGWPRRGLAAGCLSTGRCALAGDTGRERRLEARLAARLGLGSLAIVPLRARNEVIGLMALGMAETNALDDEDNGVLNVLGEQFGIGISNARMYEEALHRAERDPLTGLFNHRTLQQRLTEEMQRADRENTALAVVLMDLNNFKFFNDTYGHLCGDEVLRLVARAIEGACRPQDMGGRYGGDEFMLLLPGADRQAATAVAQNLRRSLASIGYRPPGEEQPVPLAMSYGIAVYPADAPARHDLLCLADGDLYRSKSGARDGVSAGGARAARAGGIAGYSMLDSLVRTVDNKDRYTRRHSEDVAEYACLLGQALGLNSEERETLSVAGLLHDVGKISVPDTILRKPGRLTEEEMTIIQGHPGVGALIVGAVPGLAHILPAVRHHHERWDGGGYPDGLSQTDIPLIARIMAVADAFSAMTTDRPYRNGLPPEEALQLIQKGLGTQFDPYLGALFIKAFRVHFHPSVAPEPLLLAA